MADKWEVLESLSTYLTGWDGPPSKPESDSLTRKRPPMTFEALSGLGMPSQLLWFRVKERLPDDDACHNCCGFVSVL